MRAWYGFPGARSKSCSQRPQRPNAASRLELIAERKVRRQQLTDDGNLEITGSDLREREAPPTARRIGSIPVAR
jgi:hypothetical protein